MIKEHSGRAATSLTDSAASGEGSPGKCVLQVPGGRWFPQEIRGGCHHELQV